MKNIARLFLVAAATTVSLSAQSVIQGPSSSQTSYLTPTSPGWSATSLLTVGDGIGGYLMAGIPDGLGAYSNGDGTMTVLANHEIGATQTITTVRPPGHRPRPRRSWRLRLQVGDQHLDLAGRLRRRLRDLRASTR